MSFLKKIFLSLFLCLLALPSRADENWYLFEPSEVTISGRIIYQDFFGPPNYGENPETDAVETAIILVLYKPINVKGDQEDILNSENKMGVRRIQLALPWEKIGDEELSGKNVTVKGTLFTKHTGHHRTDVLMLVKSIIYNGKEE